MRWSPHSPRAREYDINGCRLSVVGFDDDDDDDGGDTGESRTTIAL